MGAVQRFFDTARFGESASSRKRRETTLFVLVLVTVPTILILELPFWQSVLAGMAVGLVAGVVLQAIKRVKGEA